MKTILNNQRGALDMILAVVVFVLLAGAGYVYYRNHHKKVATSAQTTTVAKTAPAPAPAAKTDPNAGYFVIAQWNVRGKATGTQHLTYTVDSDGKGAIFSTTELTAADPECAKDSFWALERLSPGDTVGDQPVEQSTVARKIGNYYYLFEHSQSACATATATDLQAAGNDQTKSIWQTLEAVPTQ